MKADIRSRIDHPDDGLLALRSADDLPRWAGLRHSRWSIDRHLARCTVCHDRVAEFRRASDQLRREARGQTLTGFEAIADWSRLERERRGNSAGGGAAARCIDHVGRGRMLVTRGALAFGLLALFVAGWATHIPREQTDHVASSLRQMVGLEPRQILGTVVRTVPDGIAVRAQGVTLTIMHPPSAVLSVSGSSAVSARYIDEETGQVTITKVYGQ